MKRFLEIFFMVLGVIFFILIIAGVYFFVADPFGIRPLIRSLSGQPLTTSTTTEKSNTATVDKNPMLSPSQESALEKIGVDPAALPTTITPAMEQCFYAKLGATRANEIKAGSAPTAADFFAARSCL